MGLWQKFAFGQRIADIAGNHKRKIPQCGIFLYCKSFLQQQTKQLLWE